MTKYADHITYSIRNFGVPMNKVDIQSIMEMIDTEGIVAYTDKYGFISLLNGYNRHTQEFFYNEAPIAYSRSLFLTCLHINRLGVQSQHKKDWEEFVYFGVSIEKIPRILKWWLTNIKRLPNRSKDISSSSPDKMKGEV